MVRPVLVGNNNNNNSAANRQRSSLQIPCLHIFIHRRLPLLVICGIVLLVNVFTGRRGIFGTVGHVAGFSSSSRVDSLTVGNDGIEDKQPVHRVYRQHVQDQTLPQPKSNGGGSNNNDKFGKKKETAHQFLDFDPNFVLRYNITSTTTIEVGRQGPAVTRAITHGLTQRRVGWPRKFFDTVAASKCLVGRADQEDAEATTFSSSANNNNNNNTQQSFRRPDESEATTFSSSANNNNNTQQSFRRPDEFSKLPDAILIGVQKGGTTALYQYLDQHPRVARSTKELYVLDEELDDMIILNGGKGIPQYKAQDRYQRIMHLALSKPKVNNKIIRTNTTKQADIVRDDDDDETKQKMILDLTPHYILESDRIPVRISCIVPWVKLFVLLRDPIDRARSQYDMKTASSANRQQSNARTRNRFGNPLPSFDEYVQNDIAALQETGVIQDWKVVDFDDFWDTPAMWEAWRTYLHSGLNAPVGMGLYAMQVKPFLDLPNEFLAIRSEDLKRDTDATFQKVLDFLGLPHYSLNYYPQSNRARRKEPVSNETRALLREVFEPFNRKLGDLLGDDWKDIWM